MENSGETAYVWALPNTQVFVNTAKPEVLVTRIDDELEFLESYIEEGGHALPDMLSNVAAVLGNCEAAISRDDDRISPSGLTPQATGPF